MIFVMGEVLYVLRRKKQKKKLDSLNHNKNTMSIQRQWFSRDEYDLGYTSFTEKTYDEYSTEIDTESSYYNRGCR